MKLIPVVLCGGFGTRLWPASREAVPKPFMEFGGKTLLQHAIERGQACGAEDFVIVANQEHFFLLKDVIRGLRKSPNTDYILEANGRNTAPALALAALHISERYGPDSVMLVLSADHLIPETSAFAASVLQAVHQAEHGYLTVFGVQPTAPETGFGYIEVADKGPDAQLAVKFVEKPNYLKALEFVSSGHYYWNSGIFCFMAKSYLAALEACSPEVLAAAEHAVSQSRSSNEIEFSGIVRRINEIACSMLPDISIDYAVMERAQNIMLVPAKFTWSDVGSWQAIAQETLADSNANTITAAEDIEWVSIDTKNTHVHLDTQGQKSVIATVGLENIIIAHTPDALLVANKSNAQDVKRVVEKLREYDPESRQYQSTVMPVTVSRPWGTYTTLKEEQGYKVKKITVAPGQRLSLQYHHHRAEHWTVVSGRAVVQVDDHECELGQGEYKYIPLGAVHRLTNSGEEEMILIEVQIGDYLGEDDIVRLEDIYGRK